MTLLIVTRYCICDDERSTCKRPLSKLFSEREISEPLLSLSLITIYKKTDLNDKCAFPCGGFLRPVLFSSTRYAGKLVVREEFI
ncbi:hypothetical protein K1719_016327 [Acacia pycnantha]|nr:hypothetical protein K1719_016327 [Acacia pycnantha]